MRAEDVIRICESLSANSIRIWLTGGWGIDALLQEQTRPHKDLDFLLLLDDVVRMRELLSRDGYCLKELWSENRQVLDSHGIETPTALLLRGADGRELDAHAIRVDDQGQGIPAWADSEGPAFKKEDLAGQGTIAAYAVQCVSAQAQVLCHTGYDLPVGQ